MCCKCSTHCAQHLQTGASLTGSNACVHATHIAPPLPLPCLTCLTALAACHVPANNEVSATVVLAQEHVLDGLTGTWGQPEAHRGLHKGTLFPEKIAWDHGHTMGTAPQASQ